MQLTPQLVAELIRQKLGQKDSSNANQIILMIPEALKRTGRKIASNPDLRDSLISDKATATLPIGTVGAAIGKVDLTTGYTTHRFLLEFIDLGQIYHTSSTYPLQRVSPLQGAFVGGYLGGNANFVTYYIEGKFIVLTDPALTGNLQFAVPTYPGLLSQLPTTEEVQTLFLDTVIEVLQGTMTMYGEQPVDS